MYFRVSVKNHLSGYDFSFFVFIFFYKPRSCLMNKSGSNQANCKYTKSLLKLNNYVKKSKTCYLLVKKLIDLTNQYQFFRKYRSI